MAMRSRLLVSGAILLGLIAAAGPAQAAVQIDMTGSFNADVIVNSKTPPAVDNSQSAIDNVSYSMATQKALDSSCSFAGKGLPNNGFFPATAQHPAVQLAYRNSDDGNNVHRADAVDVFTVLIPHAKYKKVHVFLTSGDGPSDVKVTFFYADGTSRAWALTVNDWFDSPATGAYSLIGGMDRMDPTGSQCDESANGVSAHVFGYPLAANARKTLTKMKIEKTDTGYTVLSTFGAIGIKA
jgi:hypothetical protein